MRAMRVINVDSNNQYLLKDSKRDTEVTLFLNFYGAEKAEINDVVFMSGNLFNPHYEEYSMVYSFEPVKEATIEDVDSCNYIIVQKGDKAVALKRIYG